MQLIQSTLFVIPSFCHSWCSSKPKHVQQCPLRCFWHTDYVQVLIFLPNNLSMDTANCKQLRSPACCNTHSAASSPPALSLSFYIPPIQSCLLNPCVPIPTPNFNPPVSAFWHILRSMKEVPQPCCPAPFSFLTLCLYQSASHNQPASQNPDICLLGLWGRLMMTRLAVHVGPTGSVRPMKTSNLIQVHPLHLC